MYKSRERDFETPVGQAVKDQFFMKVKHKAPLNPQRHLVKLPTWNQMPNKFMILKRVSLPAQLCRDPKQLWIITSTKLISIQSIQILEIINGLTRSWSLIRNSVFQSPISIWAAVPQSTRPQTFQIIIDLPIKISITSLSEWRSNTRTNEQTLCTLQVLKSRFQMVKKVWFLAKADLIKTNLTSRWTTWSPLILLSERTTIHSRGTALPVKEI